MIAELIASPVCGPVHPRPQSRLSLPPSPDGRYSLFSLPEGPQGLADGRVVSFRTRLHPFPVPPLAFFPGCLARRTHRGAEPAVRDRVLVSGLPALLSLAHDHSFWTISQNLRRLTCLAPAGCSPRGFRLLTAPWCKGDWPVARVVGGPPRADGVIRSMRTATLTVLPRVAFRLCDASED